ncbi:MAG: DUF4412 domain-containing protein [Candidatus Eisenbacteria bacterium]
MNPSRNRTSNAAPLFRDGIAAVASGRANARGRTFPVLASALSALLASVSIASADTSVRMESDGDEIQIRFTKDFLRVDDSGGDGTFLFDAKGKVMRILEPAEQKYMEVTEADIEMMGDQLAGAQSQIADAMKQAEAALQNLPPEQRAIAMEKFKSMTAPKTAQKEVTTTRFEKAGGSETILGVKCEKYRVLESGKETGEAWVATPKELGLSGDDLSVFHELSEFLQTLPKKAGWSMTAFAALDPKSEAFVGFPMRIVGHEGTTEVLAIDHDGLDRSIFSVPEGWKRTGPMDGIR